MSKASMAAVALGLGLALTTLGASANDFRAQRSCASGGFGFDCTGAERYSGSGNNPPYCGPGLIPHVFPGGSGYRCQTLDGYGRSAPY